MNLRHLTDDVLLARLAALVRQERENIGDIVEHLGEVDQREFIEDRGFQSLFHYCMKELGYSEAATYTRIRAARVARDFPSVLDRLKSGTIHLEAIARLSAHLTKENNERLLDCAAGAPKREILSLVAQFETERPERDVIKPLPAAPPPSEPPVSDAAPALLAPLQCAVPSVVPPPSRVRFSFTADDSLVLLIDRLRELLRHRFPDGRMEDLFKAAAQELYDRLMRERTEPPRRSAKPPRKRSRRIPKAIKVEVWNRDGGRCAYVADDGRRCESRDALEYDHITPWAVGGRSDTAGNVRLLCRPHNLRLARRRFGPRRSPPTVV